MLAYVLRRFAGAVPTLFIIVTLAFFMIRLAPGGPFDLEPPVMKFFIGAYDDAWNYDWRPLKIKMFSE